ncbi:sulfate ABC transporter permease subunit [Streptomyces sp. NPDC047028]|uniref:sulfate ABC transporter permease n=1 Tax=Streptomyces sp. NPDC047028 TaxID=3155793 RepID=UPI0033C1D738
MARHLLRYGALAYLAALLLVPVGMIGYRTFEHGLAPVWEALSSEPARHALWMSLLVTVISVPVNVMFGVVTGLLLARRRMPLRGLVNLLIDLPFAMSPVVIGLALFVLYGRGGWIGDWLVAHGLQVLFALPGMVLATVFVSLPFVVREVVPVLEELGTEQEQAAEMLGSGPLRTFFSITLPALRWALVYGVVLSSARALGEYGAVSIVSGNVVGQTQTLPLYVEERFRNFDTTGSYSAGFLLAAISLAILAAMSLLNRRKEHR